MKKTKVFVAMSGGVDSSVAAALLKDQGYEIIGAHMKCFNVDGCGERDAEDARRVAEQLDIPFYVFDFEQVYKDKVVEYMIDGYKNGITPNPDVMCNREIKFGLFLEKASALGADYIATGHYVRLSANSESRTNQRIKRFANSKKIRYSLMIARDKNKDQSYFLWTLTQKQLKHCLFPIGEYAKTEVRKLAKKFGLLTAEKKDSQGICFLGEISLPEFLRNYIQEKEGDIVDINGAIIAKHHGAHNFTIGQRHLGIKGLGGGPYFVVDKNIETNTITVVKQNNPALYKREIKLTNVNFINSKLEIRNWKLGIPVYSRVRYRQPLAEATLKSVVSGQWSMVFNKPQQYVAAGQSAVFYSSKGEMLGGGVIL